MTICGDCMHCACDESCDDHVCEQDPDEDELYALMERRDKACPFHHPGNADYYPAGRQ